MSCDGLTNGAFHMTGPKRNWRSKIKIERLDQNMSYGSNGTQNTSRCAEEDAISNGEAGNKWQHPYWIPEVRRCRSQYRNESPASFLVYVLAFVSRTVIRITYNQKGLESSLHSRLQRCTLIAKKKKNSLKAAKCDLHFGTLKLDNHCLEILQKV